MACAGMRYGVFKYIEVDCCLPSRHSALGNSNVETLKRKVLLSSVSKVADMHQVVNASLCVKYI